MLKIIELPFLEPQEAYMRLPLKRHGTVLLHSGLDPLPDHHPPLSRYCFFATEPFAELVYCIGERNIRLMWRGKGEEKLNGHPLIAVRHFWKAMREQLGKLPELPMPLPSGLMGFLGYEFGVTLEKVSLRVRKDIQLPDLWLGAYGAVLTWDLHEGKLYATATGLPESGREADRLANERIEQLVAWLEKGKSHEPFKGVHVEVPFFADMTKQEYLAAVERIKSYIAAGDVYQINLAQRFKAPVLADSPSLFLRLCEVNPAPFAAFLKLGDISVLCCSPERFLHFDPSTRIAHTRPIKGTRPRGGDPTEDKVLAEELLSSEKDKAEHIMIVDLERNDLGRVAEIGSVKVKTYALEAHPTVWHLVSTIEAKIPDSKDLIDLLFAMFPGGSITGAPKIRAMEIIDEIEPVGRGIYTGSIGYWSFTGHSDFNIAIRTAVLANGMAYFHAGGGIVADSDPETEFEETLSKAKGLLRALGCSEAVEHLKGHVAQGKVVPSSSADVLA